MKNILVIGTGNSCRSQIAHGYLKYFAFKKANIYSAGIAQHGLSPYAIATMQEDGFNIKEQTSNLIREYEHIEFDYIISLCDSAKSYFQERMISKGVSVHHHFNDPALVKGSNHKIHDAFEATRIEIKDFCRSFVKQYL